MSSIRFADTVIGNLGESLRAGSRDDDEDDDADDSDMARTSDIEMAPLPHKDQEEPVRATLSHSEDICGENVAGPSQPLRDLRDRNPSTDPLADSDIHV